MGLSAKLISLVFMISLASRGVETTTVETWPSWRCMIGPYFLAKLRRTRWGVGLLSWWMFPMMGSFGGPGGKFLEVLGDNAQKTKKMNEAKAMETMVRGSMVADLRLLCD